MEWFGISRRISEYPSAQNPSVEKRLSNIFGLPYRNKLLLNSNKNKWGIDNKVGTVHIKRISYSNDAKKFFKQEIVKKGFAINEKNGYIATMSSNFICVFCPYGSLKFKLIARYIFTKEQKLKNEDITNSRIRFVNDNIFVWSFTHACVYSFKLSHNSIMLNLVDTIKDKYFRTSATKDVAITNDLLILLYDRWCGIYKLYPKLEWYHAVAFAEKSVRAFSLEIINFDDEQTDLSAYCDKQLAYIKNIQQPDEKKDENVLHKMTNKNYLFINAENQLIGIHPVNPTFSFLHIARDTQHGKVKYCISKKYGVFYLSNNGKEIYQSPNLSYETNIKLMYLNLNDVNDIWIEKGVEKFCNIAYDEQFGISGRLLLFCQTKKKYEIRAIFNHSELNPLSNEISKIDCYTGKKPFNVIIFIYEFLYGQDLIDMLLKSKSKKQQDRKSTQKW
eukprot:80271_1